MSNRYEIEAIELEKSTRQKSAATAVPAALIPQDRDATREVVMVETKLPHDPNRIYQLLRWETEQERSIRNYLVEHGMAPTPEVLASFAQKGALPADGVESKSANRAAVDRREPRERSNSWRAFHDRFMELAREEQGRADVITQGGRLRAVEQLLRASCSYKEHPEGWESGKPEQGLVCLLDTPLRGVWNYTSDGISENFRERVRLCVAEAGRALADYQKGADPEDFWLHSLYFDLLKNNSDSLFCAFNVGGMIVSVCVASATFCSRLERKALEISASSPEEGPRPDRRLKATISSHSAARRMEAYLESKGIGQTDFATGVGTTDRTLRAFRLTGRVRRDIFHSIAKAMNITKEELLRPE